MLSLRVKVVCSKSVHGRGSISREKSEGRNFPQRLKRFYCTIESGRISFFRLELCDGIAYISCGRAIHERPGDISSGKYSLDGYGKRSCEMVNEEGSHT